MKVPLSWLGEYVAVDHPEKVAEQFSAGGFAATVESRHTLPQSVVVGKVLKIEPHPNADRLRIALVDIGKGRRWKIVCGAANLAVRQYVPVALPGATLPSGAVIKTAEIRGVASRGMICSEAELGIKKASEGIMVLDEAPLATPVARLLGLDEIMLDLEIPPNRPDMLSIIGCARDYAALTDKRFLQPKWKTFVRKPSRSMSVFIQAKDGCTLYSAQKIENINAAPTPQWMQRRLRASGIRPIHAIVDVTNYVMLETGQPLHAFDAEVFPNGRIIVRHARPGEKLLALDGTTYSLPETAVVIASSEKPVAIAGIMGGEETGVKNSTTAVVLEAAVFDPVLTRKTAKALKLQTESSYRFERTVNPVMTQMALDRASALIAEITGGTVLDGGASVGKTGATKRTIRLSLDRARTMLSLSITSSSAAKILKRAGHVIRVNAKTLVVTPPHWRVDIEREEDVLEELARLYGYARLQRTYFTAPARPGHAPMNYQAERMLVDVLVGFGAYETKLHPWYGERLAQDSGLAVSDHVKLANPLSADTGLMRLHLHLNLLRSASLAARANSMVFLLETGRVFRSSKEPAEEDRASFVVVGADAYRRAKGFFQAAVEALGIPQRNLRMETVFHPLGTGEKVLGKEGIGHLIRLSEEELSRWKFRREVAFVELSLPALVAEMKPATFVPFSQYPPVLRDLSFWISPETLFADIVQAFKDVTTVTAYDVFDVFEKDGKRGIALHLTFQAPDRTLSAKEVDAKLQGLTDTLKKRFHATIR